MTYDEIISKVAASVGVPIRTTDRIYRAYWKGIREHIVSLPLKEELTDEEFLKLRPNVNIPSIGKLYVTLDRYRRIKKRHHILMNLKNKKNAENKEIETTLH